MANRNLRGLATPEMALGLHHPEIRVTRVRRGRGWPKPQGEKVEEGEGEVYKEVRMIAVKSLIIRINNNFYGHRHSHHHHQSQEEHPLAAVQTGTAFAVETAKRKSQPHCPQT